MIKRIIVFNALSKSVFATKHQTPKPKKANIMEVIVEINEQIKNTMDKVLKFNSFWNFVV